MERHLIFVSIITFNYELFHYRMQAVVIGQALLDAGYLEIIGGQANIFQDNFTLYKPSEVQKSHSANQTLVFRILLL